VSSVLGQNTEGAFKERDGRGKVSVVELDTRLSEEGGHVVGCLVEDGGKLRLGTLKVVSLKQQQRLDKPGVDVVRVNVLGRVDADGRLCKVLGLFGLVLLSGAACNLVRRMRIQDADAVEAAACAMLAHCC